MSNRQYETLVLDLGKSLHRDAALMAKADKQSLNSWIVEALRRKINGLPLVMMTAPVAKKSSKVKKKPTKVKKPVPPAPEQGGRRDSIRKP